MPWKVNNIMNERMRFVVRLQEGERMSDLCREFGISRKTGYKFWKRYHKYGPSGVFDGSKRPLRSPNSTSEAVKTHILTLKRAYPTWGAKKIRATLSVRHPFLHLPALSTIQLLLKKHGLVKRQCQKRIRGAFFQKRWTETKAPNDVWSADFKGKFCLGNGRYCYPLTISDHFSRYLICCEGLENTCIRSARGVFEAAFRKYGLPKVIRTDNGPPFATTGIAGLSSLSAWWLRLGIRIERIEPGHTEQNGRHERMHLTLKQATTRPPGYNFLQQQERFDRFIDEYNNERPHEALNMKRPVDIYVPSSRAYSEQMPDITYPKHDIVKSVTSCGKVHLFGRKHNFQLSYALAGQNVGLREISPGKWLVTFMNLDLGYVDEKIRLLQPIDP